MPLVARPTPVAAAPERIAWPPWSPAAPPRTSAAPVPLRPAFLDPLEVDDALAVLGDGQQLGHLGVGEVALGLRDQEVRRHPRVELLLLGIQPLLRQVPGGGGGTHPLEAREHSTTGRADLLRHLQLEAAQRDDGLLAAQPAWAARDLFVRLGIA